MDGGGSDRLGFSVERTWSPRLELVLVVLSSWGILRRKGVGHREVI